MRCTWNVVRKSSADPKLRRARMLRADASYGRCDATGMIDRKEASSAARAGSPCGLELKMGGVRMLTRNRLAEHQWVPIRNTPHHLIIAVSSAGGSPFDEMLERNAGLQAIVDAMNSTHPLLREIAVAQQIMQAQDHIRAWYYQLQDEHRTPDRLQAQALASLEEALQILGTHGSRDDLQQYSDFVISLAMKVARSAKEGDLFGIGGQLVSSGEKAFIDQVELAVRRVRA
jgi:hypothetical protein